MVKIRCMASGRPRNVSSGELYIMEAIWFVLDTKVNIPSKTIELLFNKTCTEDRRIPISAAVPQETDLLWRLTCIAAGGTPWLAQNA